jgi:hypothetical protein
MINIFPIILVQLLGMRTKAFNCYKNILHSLLFKSKWNFWSICQHIENVADSKFEIDAGKIFWQQFFVDFKYSYFLMVLYIDIQVYFAYINLYSLLRGGASSNGDQTPQAPIV